MLVAAVGGLGPGITATLLSAAFVALFIIAPDKPFSIASAPDLAGLFVFLCMGLFISALAEASRGRKEQERALIEQALRDSENRFRMVVDGVKDYAIFMLDPQGCVASWNSGAQRIKGWSASEILGQHFSRFFPESAVKSGHPHDLLRIAAAEGNVREEAERVRKDGSHFWADSVLTAFHDEKGNLRGYAKIIRDISARKLAMQTMAERRSRLANVVASAMDAIITIDTDQRIVLFNAAAESMFGCPAAQALGKPLEQFIPQRFRAAHANHVRDFADGGVTSRAMGKLGILSAVRCNGNEFPIEASISQANVEGRNLFTVILRDITDRQQAEQRQSLLLGELAHRVKNTLAVVQSLAAQTRRFAAPGQFDEAFNGRLTALGLVHDLLTRSEWDGASLADVVRYGLQPYDGFDTVERWTLEGPDIWLAPNEAVTLSLAFHELATNAAKFGALSNTNGKIMVRWYLDSGVEPTGVAVDWCECGGPTVVVPSRRGFGSRLLETAVVHELGGATTIDFPPTGAKCRFRFPLSPRVRVQP
jgi:PAS domain S-box-containing protein